LGNGLLGPFSLSLSFLKLAINLEEFFADSLNLESSVFLIESGVDFIELVL